MILGVDFGGRRTKLGLVDDGRVRAWAVVDSSAGEASSAWLADLETAVEALCGDAGVRPGELEGMVWALPVIISPDQRRATCSFGKFDDATEVDFVKRAEDRFGIPIVLENDARAAAIGEWQMGAGHGRSNVVMITLGTGIGTGVILGGEPLRGRSGMAGNLGGLSITHLGTPGAGALPPGCTEGQVATWALQEQAARRPEYDTSTLSTADPLDYACVFAQAERGDALACQLRDAALEAWGALTLNLIQAYDPERVIFGGGIMESAKAILPTVRNFVDRHAVQAGGTVDIVAGTLGDQAAVIGADWVWNNIGVTVA